MKLVTNKKIIIIAGPNGAGKTTFATNFLPQEAHTFHFINADLIAAGLSPFNPESVSFKAARLMLNELDEYTQTLIDEDAWPFPKQRPTEGTKTALIRSARCCTGGLCN